MPLGDLSRGRTSFDRYVRNRSGALIAAALAALLGLTAACGQSKGSAGPSAPSEPVDVTVTFRFFNHTRGALGETVRTVKQHETISLRISELGFGGVDPNTLIVRSAATGGRVGALVAIVPCTSPALLSAGACSPTQDTGVYHHRATQTRTLDVFLLNAAEGADYGGCVATALSQARTDVFLRGDDAFGTLRLAAPGERLDGEPAVAAPSDAAFRYAADEYTRALNPFGVRYGSLDFQSAPSADITGGYVVDPALPWAGVTNGRQFWVRLRSPHSGDHASRQLSYETAFHEIGHAFLGQPDQYLGPDTASFACRFPIEPFGPYSGYDNGWPVLSPLQRDILTYWALLFG